MALAPDGEKIAFTAQNEGELTLAILDLGSLRARRAVRVRPDDETDAAKAPVRLRFLRWATPQRLVFAPAEQVIPLPPVADKDGRVAPNPNGPTVLAPIMAADADGRHRGTLIDSRHFMETPAEARRTLADFLRTPTELAATRDEAIGWRMPHLDVLGFLPDDREQIVIGTRGAHSMPEQHLVDIRTASVRRFGGNWPMPPGPPQVYDWHRLRVVGERIRGVRPATAWRDDDLAKVQRQLEAKFPRRIVEIVDWSETRARTLFRVSGGGDPGRVFVYQRSEDLVLEVFRRAPWLGPARLNHAQHFDLPRATGLPVGGCLTWPKRPRSAPPPLVVMFPATDGQSPLAPFDPETEVLAEMGFAVARLSHPEFEAAVLERLRAQFPERVFDDRRLIAWGRGAGATTALQISRREPARFRAIVAIEAPAEVVATARDDARPPVLFVNALGETETSGVREPGAESTQHVGGGEFIRLETQPLANERGFRGEGYRRIEAFVASHLGENESGVAATRDGR